MTDEYQVTEGIGGMWHYHLAPKNSAPSMALCGARTMSSQVPVAAWGRKPAHMPTSYCEACAEAAGLHRTPA